MAGENSKMCEKSSLIRGIRLFFLHHAKSYKIALVVSVVLISAIFLYSENSDPPSPSYKSYQMQVESNRLFDLEKKIRRLHKGKNSSENFFTKKLSHMSPSELRRIENPRDIIYRASNSPVQYTEKRNFSELPKEMKLLRPLLFQDAPRQFLLDFKNPCYYGKYGGLECLPYFFLLGNPKCGSTDIWGKINGHPEIAHNGKESHWWSRRSIAYSSFPLSFYEATLTTLAITRMLKSKTANKSVAITGDGSPSTFWDNHLWEYFYPDYYEVGPPYIVADVIRAILPNAKLIVSFRDPTTRLYSGYVFFTLKRGETVSPEAFHDEVVSALDLFKACTTKRSIRACAYSPSGKGIRIRIRVGLYSIYTKDWFERFPPNQFKFLKLEEWGSKCTKILPQIHRHLEVSELQPSRIQAICSKNSKNENAKNLEAVGPMLNKTRKLLRDFYRPFVKELADVLNDTRFLWDYFSS